MPSVNYIKTGERTPIEQFAIDFDMPLDLAVCFVGRSESETAQRMAMFTNYMAGVAKTLREDGYPLNPIGGTIR